MAHDLNIEDVVLLIDTSRSMYRRDFKPSRIENVVMAISSLIPRKFEIDSSDKIAIVSFSDKARKIHDFSKDSDSLLSAARTMKVGGDSNIADGLALSIQLLAKEIRKIGGKVIRIIIFSDDKLGEMTNRMIKLANVAKGLGIFIDSLVSGRSTGAAKFSVLKNISLITGGDFAYFNNEHAFLKAATGMASKKDLNDVSGYWEEQEKVINSAPLLSEIAVDLRRPDINEIQEMILNPGKIKCNICYKSNDGNGPPYATIRFCPSCGRPMHLNCAAGWARNSPDANENVFRCPFCYFLLRVPRILNILNQEKMKQKNQVKNTRFSLVPPDQVPNIDKSCGSCHVIFENTDRVYKCEKCGTFYHAACAKELNEKYGGCRICGSHVVNDAEIT
ncbi:MAG: VWA domain-containing protein [Promethearchaeota archaeon]